MKKTLLALLLSGLISSAHAVKPTDAYAMTYLDALAIYLNFGVGNLSHIQGVSTSFTPAHPNTIRVEREIGQMVDQKGADAHKKEVDNLFNINTKLLDVRGVTLEFVDKKVKIDLSAPRMVEQKSIQVGAPTKPEDITILPVPKNVLIKKK